MVRKKGRISPSDIYERLEVKADRGEYSLVEPLDYLILDHLHPEGEMFAGLYPMGHTSRQINEQALGGKLSNLMLGNRMTILGKQKLVIKVNVPGSEGMISYQRSQRGDDLLKAWKDKQEAPGGDS